LKKKQFFCDLRAVFLNQGIKFLQSNLKFPPRSEAENSQELTAVKRPLADADGLKIGRDLLTAGLGLRLAGEKLIP
jgi:hypothetical protein